MARVLAQRMEGECRLCASCSAVTRKGYIVHRGGAELFVCQSCFTAQFGSDYQLVRSFEPEPVRPRPRPVARPRQVEPRPPPGCPVSSGRAPACPGPPGNRQRPGAAGAGGPR